MVKALTHDDLAMIEAAITDAERDSPVQIRVKVVKASDRYQDFILLYGFAVGSALSLALWMDGVLDAFPWLVCVQFGVAILFDLTRFLRGLCIRLVPKPVRHRRAARKAFQFYNEQAAFMAPSQPLVFLFVSLAEHSVRIITSPALHAQIPDNWNNVTDHFIAYRQTHGIRGACVSTVEHIGTVVKAFRA